MKTTKHAPHRVNSVEMTHSIRNLWFTEKKPYRTKVRGRKHDIHKITFTVSGELLHPVAIIVWSPDVYKRWLWHKAPKHLREYVQKYM